MQKRATVDVNQCNDYLTRCSDEARRNELKALIDQWQDTNNLYAKKQYAHQIRAIIKQ